MTANRDAKTLERARVGIMLAVLVLASPPANAATRLALPPGLQRTALLCLAEVQRLCPDVLSAKDHGGRSLGLQRTEHDGVASGGVACVVAKRRQLSQTCRTLADQAVSLLHGGDIHLDLLALRRHPPPLKIPEIKAAPKE